MDENLFREEEGATPLNHEEKLGLIPTYITQRSELNEVEQINITDGDRGRVPYGGVGLPA